MIHLLLHEGKCIQLQDSACFKLLLPCVKQGENQMQYCINALTESAVHLLLLQLTLPDHDCQGMLIAAAAHVHGMCGSSR